MGDLFEFFGVTSFVGVFLQSFFSEGLSDLLCGGSFLDIKKFVVLGGVDLLFGFVGLFLLLGHSLTREATKAAESAEATRKHV